MNRYTPTYDATRDQETGKGSYFGTEQSFDLPLRITVPGTRASGAPVYTPMERLAITAERVLCILEDKLVPLLVLEAQLRTLRDIYSTETTTSPDPKNVNREVSSHFSASCIKPAVQTICKKPCD